MILYQSKSIEGYLCVTELSLVAEKMRVLIGQQIKIIDKEYSWKREILKLSLVIEKLKVLLV